jgi:phosphoribosylformimino-5-aminoimidazole carboxamide ribotide isomerase
VDTKGDKVAVRGWREQVALLPEDAMRELEAFCGAFLYTHVDTEGTMSGFPIDIARRLRSQTQRQLIVAGGVRAQREVDELDILHVDAVAGMAIYTGAMHV